ncbi:adenosylmethionine--8-amino-7-oxononanoate transaminase [Legionella jordanis]|uniref:Adenosylmethionine-8-amino-7-oxononanoate aminotransferase n=2 Tax=Legionella jordanis TaxID=456 RepID=A0A0W0VAT7_9GAMM|nr:adenosylmethionine--8-amino-7-oxononanoate transaminase [Legionella jordanis]KTD17244.1 adenosylmethionine-8-amino-7-oxononanoate aminotransferase [Legionella jordanis]RMX03412.1 adenosylmethionine--8-amino-7-oxononanoate transaminase [Legionella jordanis]RMX15865.1 adenosylmethionine--8-amino-7-oxononanoate transaminase [Legionella jordanis]HAT8713367.1 adenosylmethionine--8-amino-7-oxononanoate transaminase [Legionella jordanis]
MVNVNDIIQKDLKHFWHPCTQMKDFEICPPLVIESAKGSYLHTNKGPVIDAISSWWCKSLGHGHPAILEAIQSQLGRFEHVIGAHITHPLLIELAEKLANISNNQHVFFASDGSSAVEIAIKLAMHAAQLKGQGHRKQFIALQGSYHGETLATLSVSDLGLYKKPYDGFGVSCHFLHSLPYVCNTSDPLWSNSETYWPSILEQLEAVKENSCAILVEPIIQGAGGIQCYSADFLKRLAAWAKENDLFLIADEIMTGLGRTGKWLACDHAEVQADLICLSKGLTSGSLPLSCVLIKHNIYELFYDDYEKGNSFLHSHTYSGNALALSAALATIEVMEREQINEQAVILGRQMEENLKEIAQLTGHLSNVRSIGAVAAAELPKDGSRRVGFELYQEALKRGALLRPLGRTLYWMPPLNCDRQTIEKLADITLNSIKALYSQSR